MQDIYKNRENEQDYRHERKYKTERTRGGAGIEIVFYIERRRNVCALQKFKQGVFLFVGHQARGDLKIGKARRTRVRNYVADVCHTGYVAQKTRKTQAESRMRHRAEAS